MRKRFVELTKKSVNNLNADKQDEHLHTLCKRGIGNTFHRLGWRYRFEIQHAEKENAHTYTAKIAFWKIQKRERENSDEVFEKQFGDILRKMISTGRTMQWYTSEEQAPEVKKAVAAVEAQAPQKMEIALPDNIGSQFGHIFDRDAQIRIIWQAIRAAVESDFKVRNHVLCFGKPACAKTECLLTFKRMLGEHAFVTLDATSTTKAGAENLILELETIPPFLLIEEMEKCNPANLPWLLGVLDQRAEIIKTNARVGSVRREARCLCLGTVNNIAEFKTLMSGALASRFQHKLYFQRPTRDIMAKILLREVKKMNGKEEWIEPVLRYGLEVEQTDDPRRLIALLDGRDKLLTGEYQRDLNYIRAAMDADKFEGL